MILNLPARVRSIEYYIDRKGFLLTRSTTQPRFDIRPEFCGVFFGYKKTSLKAGLSVLAIFYFMLFADHTPVIGRANSASTAIRLTSMEIDQQM
ncbi:hypothetical protein D3C75_1288300 [compost metagenome]